MALFKKGTCNSSIVVSSSVYACTSCDYTEIVRDDDGKNKECPKCHSRMKIISSQAQVEKSIES